MSQHTTEGDMQPDGQHEIHQHRQLGDAQRCRRCAHEKHQAPRQDTEAKKCSRCLQPARRMAAILQQYEEHDQGQPEIEQICPQRGTCTAEQCSSVGGADQDAQYGQQRKELRR